MSNAEKSQPSEIGLADAAGRISAILEGSQPKAEAERKQEAPAAVEETEATAEAAEETSAPDDEAASYDASEGDETADDAGNDDDASEKQLKPDTLVTVKIDGQTQKIPLKEALEGYQRQSDYSRKMGELKTERQSLEAERSQLRVATERVLQELQQFEMQEPDWQRLHQEDPINFPLIEKQWRDHQARKAQLQAQKAYLDQVAYQKDMEQKQQLVEMGRKYLLDTFAEWKDAEKFEASTKQLRQYGLKQGFTEDELGNVYDPRYVVMLEKARRYDALQEKRPQPVKQDGPRPMRSGSAASAPRAQTDVARVKQRLKSTGHVNDAAALFAMMDRK